jgi:hypothetical protein
MQRFLWALLAGFVLQASIWYIWTRGYPDPDPYIGLVLAIAYLYLGPLVFAGLGLLAYMGPFRGGAAVMTSGAEPERLWLSRGGPVFLGLLIGGVLGSLAVTLGGT